MIKSVIRFIIEKTKELWNSENLSEIKKNISSVAELFGKTLGDVTHKIGDKVTDGIHTFKSKAGEVIEKTGNTVSDAYDSMKEKGGKAVSFAKSKNKKKEAEVKEDSIEGNETNSNM